MELICMAGDKWESNKKGTTTIPGSFISPADLDNNTDFIKTKCREKTTIMNNRTGRLKGNELCCDNIVIKKVADHRNTYELKSYKNQQLRQQQELEVCDSSDDEFYFIVALLIETYRTFKSIYDDNIKYINKKQSKGQGCTCNTICRRTPIGSKEEISALKTINVRTHVVAMLILSSLLFLQCECFMSNHHGRMFFPKRKYSNHLQQKREQRLFVAEQDELSTKESILQEKQKNKNEEGLEQHYIDEKKNAYQQEQQQKNFQNKTIWMPTSTFLSSLSNSLQFANMSDWSIEKTLMDDESFPYVTYDGRCNNTMYSEYDQQQINSYWNILMPSLIYLQHDLEQVKLIYQACQVAYFAHRGQMRKSGEPFFVHPVQVAKLLTGLKMDSETVMAGLLHDTVEDTDTTFNQLQEWFGPVVRTLVEGETKVSKLPKIASSYDNNGSNGDAAAVNKADEQAENLRQMFIAMTEDYRIIIVKLADRLHNMRTLKHMKPHKQIKISRETLDIFAPLAHRMGIWQFKSELEDTSFMYLYPQEYKRLNRKLRKHKKSFKETLNKSKILLQERLDCDTTLGEQAETVEVYGRTKELYSLWHKMETKKEHNLEHIVDVVALRVIITPKQQNQPSQETIGNSSQSFSDMASENQKEQQDDTADRGVWLCYHVLGLVQHLPGFQPVPTRVKDYISFPKPNGYQSLHTALILNGQTIEVQIRTSRMHQVAEYGMASHWAYTDEKRRKQTLSSQQQNNSGGGNGSSGNISYNNNYNTPWLSSIKEWSNDRISSRDFVESVRRELLGKRVFVFLRNGKILNLSRGATAIDAAFQIHTEIGLSMNGVEINGKAVPFSYELRNGDVVSILTGDGKPSIDWMRFAKSRSTRSKLRSYFRVKQKESYRKAGEILTIDYLCMHGPLIIKAQQEQDQIQQQQHQKQGSIQKNEPEWQQSNNTTAQSTDSANNNINRKNTDDRVMLVDIPKTVQELDAYLIPDKNTRYSKVDDMLIDVGKQQDRSLLHKVVSKMFSVPSKLLINAEKNKSSVIRSSVVEAVRKNREVAKYAGKAFKTSTASASAAAPTSTVANNGDRIGSTAVNGADNVSATKCTNTDTESSTDSTSSHGKTEDNHLNYENNNDLVDNFFAGIGSTLENNEEEFADPEQTCAHCLPVYGDTIIGTRRRSESMAMIHRIGCTNAQRVMNKVSSPSKEINKKKVQGDEISSNNGSKKNYLSVNSKSLRQVKRNIFSRFNSRKEKIEDYVRNNIDERDHEIPVRLCWPVYLPDGDITCLMNGDNHELQQEPERNENGDCNYYLTEVVVHAKDRKLLLADCSEVVSELSEIVKTGSSSSKEHATLVFLVKVNGLAHLQKVMDTLFQVRAVMSVERKFGSDLL